MDSPSDYSEDALSLKQVDSSVPTPEKPGGDGARVRRRPIPKKGHTKSRRGCLCCKRRKVKCQEDLPECTNCKRLGFKCVYPGSAASSSELSPAPVAPLRTAPGTFTMEDMRYFHHFLVTAYPPLPMGGDEVWKGVAALSHQYDYLVHSMLGLAASHLSLYTGNDAPSGLAHRVKAISALNESLNRPCASAAEGDARFGAIMALTFQASCMPEGMTEFLSMIRGCHIIASTGMIDFNSSLFQEFTAEGYTDSIRRLIGSGGLALEPQQAKYFDDFLVSLRNLGPLCTSPLEVRFLAATERVMKQVKFCAVDGEYHCSLYSLYSSLPDTDIICLLLAFTEFTKLYALITAASNEEFGPFLDPSNYSAQLILIHFFFIEFAIGELSLGPLGERFGFRRRAALSWLNGLLERLPDEYRSYVEWPLKHARVLAAGLSSPFNLNQIHPAMPQFIAPRPALSLT